VRQAAVLERGELADAACGEHVPAVDDAAVSDASSVKIELRALLRAGDMIHRCRPSSDAMMSRS
jgi:hypothetical protein